MADIFRYSLERDGVKVAGKTFTGTASVIRDRLSATDLQTARLIGTAARLLVGNRGGTVQVRPYSYCGSQFVDTLTMISEAD